MIPAFDVPSFSDLCDQFAVILHGRRLASEHTCDEVQALAERVAQWREALDVPVALVGTQGWSEDASATFHGELFVGVLVACRAAGERPIELEQSDVEAITAPASVWARAASEGVALEGDDDAYWVVPTGWSQALLIAGELEEEEDLEPEDEWEGDVEGEDIAMVSSEDTEPSATLDPALLDGDDPAYFWCVSI